MELWDKVSSMMVTLSSLTSTMLERAEVTKVFSSMADIGLSFARIPERFAYSVMSLSRCFWMPVTKAKRALSCHQVCLPCQNASGQLERMW